MKQKILFHVGLHKTGTTSLQQDFFIPDNQFLQHPKGRLFWLPIFVNKFSTEPLSINDKSTVQRFAKLASESNLIPVVSHERLSGYPISGGYDRLSIYRRIASLDLDVKILFVMREQKSWLYSTWRQMISDGGSIRLKKFLIQKPRESNVRLPGPRYEHLNYSSAIETLSSIFGRENVLVFPFELIVSKFPSFIENLGSLLEEDLTKVSETQSTHRNARKTLTQFYVQWAVNRCLVSSTTSPKGLIPRSTKIGKAIRVGSAELSQLLPEVPYADAIIKGHKQIIIDTVGSYFADSNKSSAEMLSIDLASLGYDV